MPDATSILPGLAARQPPANMRAEQGLLGALMANNKVLDRVAEYLRPDHFVDPIHGEIYARICDMVSRGRPADAVTLTSSFGFDGILDDVGGTAYLAELLTAMPGLIIAGEYGRAIHDAWVRRELIDALSLTVEQCFIPGGRPASDITEELESRLLKIAQGAGDIAPAIAVAQAVREAVVGTRIAADRRSGLAGLTTGYAALDRMTTGLHAGAYIVLAARPSMGKTGLGLGIAARAAASGAKVLFWSGEMSATQLGARMAAARAWLSTTSVFTGRGYDAPDDAEKPMPRPLHSSEWADLAEAERRAERLNLWIDSRPAITVPALRARASRMKRTGGLDLLVVDYLGLMRGSEESRRQGRTAEVTDISAALTALKRELGIPILVLSQLNRANEAREDKRATLADLRDSGAVEQDADVVMFLHRPHYYLSRQGPLTRRPKESDEEFANRTSETFRQMAQSKGVAEINVAKNRHGPTGMTRLRFVDRTTWFFDESEPERADAWPNDGGWV